MKIYADDLELSWRRPWWTDVDARNDYSRYRNQPSRIEDYEPGHSSIARREVGHFEPQEMNRIIKMKCNLIII